jgi:hypothetical protein
VGGGHFSDRYADSLGAKAFHGYTGHCRQDLIGADYGLLDCRCV